MLCYCKSNIQFGECCEPIIKGRKDAETAEQLMRSRYSAYAAADIDYLMKSHHHSTRPLKERQNILKWTKSVTWVTLEIISKENGLWTDASGYVEFKAIFMENGKLECIHENSYFVKENNIWYYQSAKLK